MTHNTISVTQQAGQTYVLKNLLQSWGLPEEYHAQMSEAWECELAQECHSEEEAILAFMKPQPVLPPQSCGQAVLDETGSNVFEYLVRPDWNEFPRARFAMLGGWGAPGTPVTGEEHVALVHSFSEILSSPQPLNLQMFHRSGPDAPRIPNLPELLKWPLPNLLGSDGSFNAVVCDGATRVSRRGALTWWHLDDGGEAVLQVAANVGTERLHGPVLLGPSGKPVVKMFVFAPSQYYDFISQDAVSEKTGKFSQLQLFKTPPDHLPSTATGSVLPTMHVALLEAGGPPLLSPPNWPHLVLTLQDCVMVEQRRVFRNLADEVVSFIERASLWRTPPIFYPCVLELMNEPEKAAETGRHLQALLGSPFDTVSGDQALQNCKSISLPESFQKVPEEFLRKAAALCPEDGRWAQVAACMRCVHCRSPGTVRLPDCEANSASSLPPEAGSQDSYECTTETDGDSVDRDARACKGGSGQQHDRFLAFSHEGGCVRWAAVRKTVGEAVQDRKGLLAARRAGRLKQQ